MDFPRRVLSLANSYPLFILFARDVATVRFTELLILRMITALSCIAGVTTSQRGLNFEANTIELA